MAILFPFPNSVFGIFRILRFFSNRISPYHVVLRLSCFCISCILPFLVENNAYCIEVCVYSLVILVFLLENNVSCIVSFPILAHFLSRILSCFPFAAYLLSQIISRFSFPGPFLVMYHIVFKKICLAHPKFRVPGMN